MVLYAALFNGEPHSFASSLVMIDLGGRPAMSLMPAGIFGIRITFEPDDPSIFHRFADTLAPASVRRSARNATR